MSSSFEELPEEPAAADPPRAAAPTAVVVSAAAVTMTTATVTAMIAPMRMAFLCFFTKDFVALHYFLYQLLHGTTPYFALLS